MKLLSAASEPAATRPTTRSASGLYATSGSYKTGSIRTWSDTDRLSSLQPVGKILIRLHTLIQIEKTFADDFCVLRDI